MDRTRQPNLDIVRAEYTRWLAKYPWQWMLTLTFPGPLYPQQLTAAANGAQQNRTKFVHPQHARKLFGVFVHWINHQLYGRGYYKHPGTGIYWVLAQEYQKNGQIHYHALMAADDDLNLVLSRKKAESKWQSLAGFAVIKPVTNRMTTVTDYVGKYVYKEGDIELSDTMACWQAQQLSGDLGSD